MSKISATKTEKETEVPYYKYCYGKWIRVGTIKQEQNGDKTNKPRAIRTD